jgi:hypothetical protein
MSNPIQWLTIREAADRACCRPAVIQRAVRRGRLRSAHGGHGELKFVESWIDEWLIDQLMPEEREIGVAIDVAPSMMRERR